MNIKKKKENSVIGFIFYLTLISAIGIYCYRLYKLVMNKQEITNDIVIGIVLIFAVILLAINNYINKLKPKASSKWREIEHGSNEFQTQDEKNEFLKNCTDNQINLSNDEINKILLFLGEK